MILFTDTYEKSIDNKKRLQIPSQFRKAMAGERDPHILFVVPGNVPKTLGFYPVVSFELLAGHYRDQAIISPAMQKFNQLLYSRSSRLDMDDQGRVVIPDRHLEAAGVTNSITLAGAGDHFVGWRPEDFAKYSSEDEARWEDLQREAQQAMLQHYDFGRRPRSPFDR